MRATSDARYAADSPDEGADGVELDDDSLEDFSLDALAGRESVI